MPATATLTVLLLVMFGPDVFAQRVPGTAEGPLARAIPRAAAMLAASDSGAQARREAGARLDADTIAWSHVMGLKRGAAIAVRVKGAPVARHVLVDCDWERLTVAERWGRGPSGTVSRIPRADVVELSVIRKHVGRHTGRGTLIGAGIGGLALGVPTALDDDCTGEYCNAAGMAALGAMGGGMYGTLIGLFIGAVAPPSPDVVYRAPGF